MIYSFWLRTVGRQLFSARKTLHRIVKLLHAGKETNVVLGDFIV